MLASTRVTYVKQTGPVPPGIAFGWPRLIHLAVFRRQPGTKGGTTLGYPGSPFNISVIRHGTAYYFSIMLPGLKGRCPFYHELAWSKVKSDISISGLAK